MAASQYFHGGDYQRALKLARRVEERLLPSHVRHHFAPFSRDVKDRAREGYRREIDNKLRTLASSGRPEAALELLKSHPYVYDRTRLAYARGYLCEELRRYHAAAIFYASAMKFQPDDPGLAYVSSAKLQWLPTVGRLEEALEYIRYQLEEIGHAVTYITASILSYRRAMLGNDQDEQRNVLKEQVSYCENAWKFFQQLPDVFQHHSDLRGYMALCFEVAGFALWKLGEAAHAVEICETALRFHPSYPGLWTMRGVVAYTTSGAVADLEQAVRLGEKNYYPYYYLAHHALKIQNPSEGMKWITQALSLKPSKIIAGQLYGWLAICLYEKGASIDEIEGVFAKAHELAPQIEEIAENHKKFRALQSQLNSQPDSTLAKATVWDIPLIERGVHDSIISSALERQQKIQSEKYDSLRHDLLEA